MSESSKWSSPPLSSKVVLNEWYINRIFLKNEIGNILEINNFK